MTLQRELSPSAERIVNVAQALIQARGYNGFSYEDIAQTVGIRKPSVHHHFASKAQLATVVAQRYVDRFADSLARLNQKNGTPHATLEAYAQLFQDTYDTDRQLCVCGMLGAEAQTLPDSVRHELSRFFDLNMQWLTETMRPLCDADESRAQSLALLLLSALEGAMIVGRSRDSAQTPMQAAHVFLSLLPR